MTTHVSGYQVGCLMLAVVWQAPGGGNALGCALLCCLYSYCMSVCPTALLCFSLCFLGVWLLFCIAVSEAGTEWSDGVAVAYKAQQQRQHGVGFAALITTPEVWAICAAQYTGAHIFSLPAADCLPAKEGVQICVQVVLEQRQPTTKSLTHPILPLPCPAMPPPCCLQGPGVSMGCSTGCPPSSRITIMWRFRSWHPSPCCHTWFRAAWGQPQVGLGAARFPHEWLGWAGQGRAGQGRAGQRWGRAAVESDSCHMRAIS